jgi:uncharacterized membrane protein
MSILSDLHELVNANVITGETAQQIAGYYRKKQEQFPPARNRQLLVFGILGALLVGTGLMFIIANQWEELPRSVKTFCAFLLLIVPQLLCFYAMVKKPGSVVWRESTALLLFFAVGASISLVSQIYRINGEQSTFLLTWMLLIAPMIYLLNSSAVSLAFLFGMMSYGFSVRFDPSIPWGEQLYWLLLLVPIPRYLQLLKTYQEAPLFVLHHWAIPAVLTLTIGTVSHNFGVLLPPVYFTLFGIFYMIGNLPYFNRSTPELNGFRVVGVGGAIVTLVVMSFKSNWEKLLEKHFEADLLLKSPEFLVILLLVALAFFLMYREIKNRGLSELKPMEFSWLVFLPIFVLGCFSTLAVILVNLLVLLAGIWLIRKGTSLSNLGFLNAGMLVITSLLICRSVDIDLSLVVKGLFFVVVGIGFFVANWWILKKRKENEA